ncbi:MAG: peptidylprolyl isomerase [Kofleriaceae bacterium]
MRLLCVCLLVSACDAGAPPPTPAPSAMPIVAPPPAPPDADDPRPPTREDLDRYLRGFPRGGTLVAKIETSEGTLHCELFPDRAPLAVANFLGLATGQKAWRDPTSGTVQHGVRFYDGLTFHRVIPEFMIQGGDPLGRGVGGPGYQFADETFDQGTMEPGTLAMANAGRDTNGSQFFVMEEGSSRPDLVAHYTRFGHCSELDVIKQIARVPRDRSDKPIRTVTIEHVTFTRGTDPWH